MYRESFAILSLPWLLWHSLTIHNTFSTTQIKSHARHEQCELCCAFVAAIKFIFCILSGNWAYKWRRLDGKGVLGDCLVARYSKGHAVRSTYVRDDVTSGCIYDPSINRDTAINCLWGWPPKPVQANQRGRLGTRLKKYICLVPQSFFLFHFEKLPDRLLL